MIRLILRATPWILAALFAFLWLSQSFSRFWDNSTDAHSLARAQFYGSVNATGCIQKETVIKQAKARDWTYRDLPDYFWCHAATEKPATWLQVIVSPPLPFSTEDENSAIWAFDAKGCHIEWRNAQVTPQFPYTNCPD